MLNLKAVNPITLGQIQIKKLTMQVRFWILVSMGLTCIVIVQGILNFAETTKLETKISSLERQSK